MSDGRDAAGERHQGADREVDAARDDDDRLGDRGQAKGKGREVARRLEGETPKVGWMSFVTTSRTSSRPSRPRPQALRAPHEK